MAKKMKFVGGSVMTAPQAKDLVVPTPTLPEVPAGTIPVKAAVAIPAKAAKSGKAVVGEKEPAIATALLSQERAREAAQAIDSVLAEWYEWAGWQGEDARTCREIARTHRSLRSVKPGTLVRSWEQGGPIAEVVEQFDGSCTKIKVGGVIENWSQGTAVEIVPPSEVPHVARVIQQGDGTTAVIKTETTARKNKIDVFGYSHTKFFMWAGSKGWEMADVQKCLANMNLPVVSELSIKCFLRAGKDSVVRIREKRGDLPVYTPDQENLLAASAGKEPLHVTKVVEAPKSQPKAPKSPKKK